MTGDPHPDSTTPSVSAVDRKTKETTGPLRRDMKRFDFYLIDTGWNVAVSKVVRGQLRRLLAHQIHDTLYELTADQSVEILKRDPDLIGCDPTIFAYDIYASTRPGANKYRGFRLNLGLMRHPEQALARLQEFLRFIATHRTAERLDQEVRRELHREGIDGVLKLLSETSAELLIG
jgi:hypothetical protein